MTAGMKNVVSLRRADSICACMRDLADRIERGEIQATEAVCIIRGGIHEVDVWNWGDYRGNIAAVGLIECGKRVIETKSQDDNG